MPTPSPASRHTGLAVCFGVALLLSACEYLPTAPSSLTAGVAIFAGHNFTGASALITKSYSDLDEVDGGPCTAVDTAVIVLGALFGEIGSASKETWDDCISSVKVAPGWRVMIYEHPDFKGKSLELTADSDLALCPAGGELGACAASPVAALLDDEVSSVRVFAL